MRHSSVIKVMETKKFKRHILPLQPALQQMAERLLGGSAQAEDAVQETVVRLWEMRDRLDEVKNIEGYCLTMLKRHCIDLLRQSQSVGRGRADEHGDGKRGTD